MPVCLSVLAGEMLYVVAENMTSAAVLVAYALSASEVPEYEVTKPSHQTVASVAR